MWVEQYIRERRLTVGDAMPTELEIAAAAGVGRSSVREALTALKVLGIIESRRKGGIRLVRDPVLLELRHYFSDQLEEPGVYDDAMAFRAVLEWGLGPLVLAKCRDATIRTLRETVASVAAGAKDWATINAAEIRFHTALATGCGNRLATLLTRLYLPIFAPEHPRPLTPDDIRLWVAQHGLIIDALAAEDSDAFLAALRQHTHGYMRLKP